MRPIFLSGIGTDIGKTVVAAILARAWGMAYWKPVQAGGLEFTDSDRVREWTEGKVPVHPEAFRLNEPMSPHAAARKDGVRIRVSDLELPSSDRPLLIEGAGGLMVPLNDDGALVVDLVPRFDAELILVSWNFLGSINQTLLSCEALERRGIPVRGIVFNGPENPETERIIGKLAPFPVLGRIPEEDPSAGMVKRNAEKFGALSPFDTGG